MIREPLHIVLDLWTSYGTRALLPFDSTWYSWDWMFIIDPVFLFLLLTACFGARIDNPGEAITGSADAGGFGSGTNGLSSTGSVSDQIVQILKGTLSAH